VRNGVFFFFAGIFIIGLLGCGGSKPQPLQTAAEKQKINIWHYWEGANQGAKLNTLIEEFNNSQEMIMVKSKYIPFPDFNKQLAIGVTASELPDIVIIDSCDHASYIAIGIFADISGKIDVSQYYEGPRDSCTLEGKLYGVPFGSNCVALFYNKDMYTAAGIEVPQTWEEFRIAARVLTSDRVRGIVFSATQSEEGTFNFMPWLWSAGGDSFQIDSSQGIRALTMIRNLVNDGSLPREVINWTQADAMNQFITGRAAMMTNGPWQVPVIRRDAPDLNWGVALLPRDVEYASVLGGENFAIIKNDNVDASLEFIRFLVDPQKIASYIDEFGYIASRRDVAAGQFAGDEVLMKFAEQLQYAQARGPHARWPEISEAISLALNEVITQPDPPADIVARAQAAIDRIVK
jgi:multiple sugar transport system substrate-binding protein